MTSRDLPQRVADLEAALDSRALNIEAALSAHRFMLEQVYANTFMQNETVFRALMAAALERTRTASAAAEPGHSAEALMEQTALTLVWLERFRDSVLLRIRQGLRR